MNLLKKLFKLLSPINFSLKTQVILILTLGFFALCGLIILVVPARMFYDYRPYLAQILLVTVIVFTTLMAIFIIFFASPVKIFTLYVEDAKNFENDLKKPKIYNKEYQRLMSKFHELTTSLTTTIHTLDSKNKSIAKYTEELSTEYQLKKDLVASISHEIKTPLTSIGIIVNSIVDGVYSGSEVMHELRGVLSEIDNMNDMLQQIVSLYHLEGTNFHLRLEKNHISNLLNQALSSCQQIAINYRQSIAFNNLDFVVFVDTELLVRALKNVLFNAITYSPINSKVEIVTKEFKFYNILEIINYGVTIDEGELSRLFEPFYRLDKSRTKGNDHGNGLGLYIVAQTLRKHKLEFDIVNIPNGVKFYIQFPKVKNN